MRNGSASDLQAMLDRATDGAVTLDAAGRILSLNEPAERLFGYRQNEIAGESVLMLLAPQSHPETTARLEALSRSRRGRSGLPPAAGSRARSRRRFDSAGADAGADRSERSPALLRACARSHPRARGRAAPHRRARRRRGRERRQDRLSRPGQPRNPHAVARHPRLRRSDDGGALRPGRQRALQGLSQGHPRLRQPRDEPRRRPARSEQDRGGQARTRLRRRRRQQRHPRVRVADAAAGGARAGHHARLAPRPPAAGDGRRALAQADHAEPDVERGEVQRAGRAGDRLDRRSTPPGRR